ncbi:MAG: UvrD-helicase domain-containing protein [Gemmataceae bacterium]
MNSPLTEQQRRAVQTRGTPVVLSSGAGCGKTHVLTQRYLSHLREGVQVGELVAITFTDRAARQMRGRIRAAVTAHVRAAGSDEEAEAWARHLRALENASICTIHAFCGALLRQHAVEAGLDPSFEVLEEVLAVNLRRDAVTGCLQRLLLAKTPIADDLRELVLLYGWKAVNETVEALLHDFDARPWGQWTARSAMAVAGEWLAFARDELLPRHLRQWLGSSPAVTHTLDLLRRHPPQPGPMAEPVATILRETPRLAAVADLPAAIKRLIEAAKVGRAGAKAWPDPAEYAEVKAAFEEFREELRKLEPERFEADEVDLAAGVEVGQRWLRVAAEAMRAYDARKRQHGVVDFQDLLLRARDLLREQPAVLARLQQRWRYLLIDELQDTDPVQMELVEALAGGDKLFAVGDHKQSIYRFRGAEVALFRGLRRCVPEAGRQSLSVNFRSRPGVLDFVNALMADALDDYEPLVASLPPSAGPCVEFLWTTRAKGAGVAEGRAAEAGTIARRVAAMVRAGEARPGDVVLLFRAMSNVHLYEAALRRSGLDYYLVGGRAFFAQQEVYDVVNLLRALENPLDAVSLAGALRSPFGCVSDEALFVLCRHRAGPWAALADEHTRALLPEGQRDRVARAARNLARWRDQKDRLSIAQLLNSIFAESGYDAALQMEFLGERKLANLWKLIELGRAFDRPGLFGLAEFIARLADLVASQPREEQAATLPESADVVRLMSIHQAKGLEFPVVIVPDLAARSGPASSPAARWNRALGCVARPPAEDDEPAFPEFGARLLRTLDAAEEWNEDLRTLYVACTRPREYLILSASLEEDYRPEGAWMQTLARRFDLMTGAPPGDRAGPSLVRVTGGESCQAKGE